MLPVLSSGQGRTLTGCLEGRFRQGVNLRMPTSEAVRSARRRPLVTAVCRPFWHGRGTDANTTTDASSRVRIAPRLAPSPRARWPKTSAGLIQRGPMTLADGTVLLRPKCGQTRTPTKPIRRSQGADLGRLWRRLHVSGGPAQTGVWLGAAHRLSGLCPRLPEVMPPVRQALRLPAARLLR